MTKAENGDGRPDALVVFGTGWCPDVRRSRELLDGARVDYRYVDLEADPVATRFVRSLQQGRRRVSTLLWPDGSFLVEPTDEELRVRLTETTTP